MTGRKKTTKAPVRAAAPPRGSRGKPREGAVFPVPAPRAGLPLDYAETLSAIKRRIQQERLRVVVAANSAMVLLYWDIGRMILDRQQREGWGARVIDRHAADLRQGYPDMKGFSARNLLFMRSFAEACPDAEKVKQLVSQLPWGHVIRLLQRVKEPEVRVIGQINVYLSAVDDLLRHPGDKPTIGLLLCRSKDRIVVEYALRDLKKPIGVAGWETKIVEKRPEYLEGSLPSVEEIEAELSREENER